MKYSCLLVIYRDIPLRYDLDLFKDDPSIMGDAVRNWLARVQEEDDCTVWFLTSPNILSSRKSMQ